MVPKSLAPWEEVENSLVRRRSRLIYSLGGANIDVLVLIIIFRMEGNVSTFDSTNFIQTVAAAMEVDTTFITILNVTSGSVIVEFCIFSFRMLICL
jgi:hypothetical protein